MLDTTKFHKLEDWESIAIPISEDIDEQAIIEKQWWEVKSMQWMAELMWSLASTFYHPLYVEIINNYISDAEKKLSMKKYDMYNNVFISVYQIILNWYNEINFDTLDWDDINIMTVSTVFADMPKSKDYFIVASRLLLKRVDSLLKAINKKPPTPKNVWSSNVLKHVFTNWVVQVAWTFKDKDLIKRCLKWLSTISKLVDL